MPEMFGRYELHDLLGRGGMGEVYRALDTVRDRTVALKLLPKHLASDESFKTRFRRESRTAARLNDPHIVPIHDFGEIDGQLFIDMRLVDGRDLGSVLADRGSLPASIGIKIISQVASALEAAHQSGLVHRDVKPSNVLLAGWSDSEEDEPFAYLVDFGIARAANQEGTALTATSGTVGTVAYMSPERIGGSPGDRRTDIYALGCVLYETLAGRKPFDGEIFAIMYAHMNTPPPRLSEHAANTPPALDEVIAKAMAKEPDDRYATTSEFALAARQALRTASQPISAPPPPAPGPVYGSRPPAPPTQAPPGQQAPPHPSAPIPPYPSAPVPPYPGTPTSPQHPSGPLPPVVQRPPAATTQHGPSPFAPPQNLGPPPGPVRPTTPSQPVRPPSWAPPPSHVSGPIGGPPTLPVGSRRNRKGVLIGAGAVAVVAAIVLTLVFALGGSGNSAQGPGSSTSSSSASAPAHPASYKTGGPSTPVVDWAHFGSYSRLVGARNGDSAHAFQDGNCRLSGIQADDPRGLLDQVQCTYQSGPVSTTVQRYQSQRLAYNYLVKLSAHANYAVTPFTINNRVVGLRYTPPATEPDLNVVTYMCGLPAYLVEFYAPDRSATSLQSILDNYWSGSTFPDVVPEECNDDFSGIKSGSTPTLDGLGGIKTPASVPDNVLESWAQLGQPDWDVALVDVPTGAEMIVVGQTKSVSFWRWNKTTHEITHGGFSSYPYSPSKLGQPQATARGTVLTGMTHATFIVVGRFSTDGAGNAVAYTYSSSKGWGAIKAEPNGNLAPSGQGVGVKGIGLSQEFDFSDGMLETADCSRTLPVSQCSGDSRVLKYWSWSGSEFVLDHTAGLSR